MSRKGGALVTGGGSGIGRGICLQLAKDGYNVGITDVNLDGAHETKAMILSQYPSTKVHVCKLDVANFESFKAALADVVANIGNLTVLVNNAGVMEELNSFASSKPDLVCWDRQLNINLKGVLFGTWLAIKQFNDQGNNGAVINVASIAGTIPVPEAPIYAAVKSGVIHFTRSLAHFGQPNGGAMIDGRTPSVVVRVNAVAPHFVNTPMLHYRSDAKDVQDSVLKVEDVTNAVRDLINDESKAGAITRIVIGRGAHAWPLVKKSKL
eukprot:GILI01017607.1.p1 GENE.GILI01017607.1~~GILI01017607.1.p1  ORF type:complete len:266 (+),score=67.87 GILI01017607.1:38-835(+)